MRLPDPAQLPEDDPQSTAGREGSVNLAVHGAPDPAAVDLTDDGYAGDAAGAAGRLAAAVAVAGDRPGVRLQYPDPDFTADGPWLVLASTGGFLATVATGTGRVVVAAEYDAAADPGLETLDSLVADLIDAARPSHDHYPVADDAGGVFTTGMTTFSLDSLAVDDADEGLRATFSASTTPATTRREVESAFADVGAVSTIEYDPTAGVDRADPSDELRAAVESAHRQVVGDAQYDWLAEGDAFARIPGGEKVAFGPDAPGDESFSHEQYETCVALLEATLEGLDGASDETDRTSGRGTARDGQAGPPDEPEVPR